MSYISHSTSKYYAIIVAGGTGTRMQSAVPKQFLLLHGIPVLMHTIRAFYSSKNRPQIIVVLHPYLHAHWQQLCSKHHFTIEHQLVNGGDTRFDSVKNGLSLIDDKNALVAVHDAVRPLISREIIDNAYSTAGKSGNAIVAVKSRDSIRQITPNGSQSLNRNDIYLVQTPQTFQYGQLKKAYEQAFSEHFTDDASVVEKSGITINLIEGSHQNIKITFPEDIAIAELLLKK